MKSNFSLAKLFCAKRIKRYNSDKMLNGASPQMPDQRSSAGPKNQHRYNKKIRRFRWRILKCLIHYGCNITVQYLLLFSP